jgi:anti-anti-sigma factor
MVTGLALRLDAPSPGEGRIRASGDLDAATAHALLDAVDVQLDLLGPAARIARFELDLSAVVFCDVAGARAVLTAADRATRRSAHVDVLGSRSIRRALDLSGLRADLTGFEPTARFTAP